MASFQSKKGTGHAGNERKKKNYRSYQFLAYLE